MTPKCPKCGREDSLSIGYTADNDGVHVDCNHCHYEVISWELKSFAQFFVPVPVPK